MTLSDQIAKHLRHVHFGGNWTASCMKDILKDVTWQQATMKVQNLNTIAALVFHTNYYVCVVMRALKGEPLNAHDKYSFDVPPIASQEDWEKLKEKAWADAETVARLIEQLPDNELGEDFAHPKYGTWYRNLGGLIEHTHYHLGQMALIKKML
ncbi:MAG: DinB family protein [Bacteroidota bacterium]